MLKYLNLPAILLTAFLIRLLIVGSGIGDSIVLLALSLVYFGTYYYKGHKEEPINKVTLDRLVEVEEQLKLTKDKINSLNFGFNLKK